MCMPQLLIFLTLIKLSCTTFRAKYELINNRNTSSSCFLKQQCGYEYVNNSYSVVEINWSSGTCEGLPRQWTLENRTFSEDNGYMIKTAVIDVFSPPVSGRVTVITLNTCI